MPQFTTNVLYDNYERSVVQFIYGGGGGAVAAGNLTGSIQASSLTGYDSTQAVGSTAVNINVSKVFWSLPQGATGTAVELSWGVSGSLTGTPFLYLNGSGYVNYTADAIVFRNTDTAATRRNYVQVRNTSAMTATDTITVVLELDKNGGYIRQM
jgi:hypothetical protein